MRPFISVLNFIANCKFDLLANDNCISNNERGAKTKFNIIKGNSLSIQCVYCGRKIAQDNIIFI